MHVVKQLDRWVGKDWDRDWNTYESMEATLDSGKRTAMRTKPSSFRIRGVNVSLNGCNRGCSIGHACLLSVSTGTCHLFFFFYFFFSGPGCGVHQAGLFLDGRSRVVVERREEVEGGERKEEKEKKKKSRRRSACRCDGR